MHTMHHRSAAPSLSGDVASPSRTSSSNKGGNSGSGGSRRRRVKRSSVVVAMGRQDLMVTIFAACFLTAVSVLIVLKLYATLSSNSSSSTLFNNRLLQPLLSSAQKSTPAAKKHTTDDASQYDKEDILPWNKRYRVPGSMPIVGDRSNRYVELRQMMDRQLEPASDDNDESGSGKGSMQRSLDFVSDMTQGNIYNMNNNKKNNHRNILSALQPASQDVHHSDQVRVPYDIFDCPPKPPPGYPFAWPTMTVLENWPPDDTAPPASGTLYQGLCVFDYGKDYDTAMVYRNAELPFVVINDPAVAETVERWNRPGYMAALMGPTALHRTEYSPNNHFMYYVAPPKHHNRRRTGLGGTDNNNNNNVRHHTAKGVPEDWVAPTKMLRMTYADWLRHANVTNDDQLGPHNPHWYYRLIGCGGTGNDGSCDKESSEYLFDELTFFQPKENLYIVEPDEQKGYERKKGNAVFASFVFNIVCVGIVEIIFVGGSKKMVVCTVMSFGKIHCCSQK